MPIRKLLLPLTGTAAGEAAIGTALMVARQWNAHLLGLHVRADSRDVAPLAGEGLSGAMIQEMMQATERESGQRSAAIRTMFDHAIEAAGIHIEQPTERADHPTATFATVTGREEDVVAQQARLVRPDSGAASGIRDGHIVLGRAARRAVRQRPAGVDRAPPCAPASLGKRVAVAWNGTGEGAAAVQAGAAVAAAGGARCGSCRPPNINATGRPPGTWPTTWRCTA